MLVGMITLGVKDCGDKITRVVKLRSIDEYGLKVRY